MSETTPNAQAPFGLNEPNQSGAPPPTENEKLLAGLSYFSQILVPAVLPVVLLLVEETKRSAFLRHHAVHSLALLVATIIYELAALLAYALVSLVAPCLVCISWILFLLPVGVLAYYGVTAFLGKHADIPYMTQFLKDNRCV